MNASAAEYLEVFSLHSEPFADGLDTTFFYASTALAQRLDLLSQLTEYGESVILVSGPSGSGKTTLLSRYVEYASDHWTVCVLTGDGIGSLGRHLAEALGSDLGGDELQVLDSWDATTDPSDLLVIVVDDAERLDQDARNRLIDLLRHPCAERIRIVLFGEPGVERHIGKAVHERAPAHSAQLLEIPRLSPEDTAAYLSYRLAVAGYSGKSPFTATQVRGICKAAGGRPGDINRLADEALREQYLRRRSASSGTIDHQPPTRARRGLWWSAALGVLAVVAFIAWQRLSSSFDIDRGLSALARTDHTHELPLRLPSPARETETPQADSSRVVPAAVVGREDPLRNTGSGTPSRPQPGATAASDQRHAAVGQQQDEGSESATRNPADGPHPVNTTTERQATADTSVAAPDSALPATPASNSPATERQTAPHHPVADIAAAETQADVDRQRLAQGPTTLAQATASAKVEAPHREDWLLNQPATLYSLQLLGSRNEKAVLKFIEEYRLELSDTAYYKGSFKETEWFVLLYGLYPSREAAISARDTLPKPLRKSKPWPRSLESVQSAIREVER